MRRCAIHGTENNCAANVAGGICGGILNGTDDSADLANPAPHAHDPGEASQRLGAFADVIDHADDDADYAAACQRYDEELAQLQMSGHSSDNARIMMDAPGSKWHGFSAFRAEVDGQRHARAADAKSEPQSR